MATISDHFWLDRPVFVTGCTGLVGNFVLKKLCEKKANVVCLVRDWVPTSEAIRSSFIENVTVVRGELQDQSCMERLLNEYEIQTVLHLAAQAVIGTANRNPVSTFESNVRGTWTLLEACRRNPTVEQIVVASSDKAYGAQAILPYTEDMPLTPMHPYDVSKGCADLIAQSYAKSFGLPVVISRCGNFFGEGDVNWSRIVPGVIRSVIRGESPTIRSDGTYVRDYLYADDGALGYLLLAEKLAENPELSGEAFNFSLEKPMTVLKVTEMILKLMASDLKPKIKNEASNEIKEQHLSAKRARNVLGWKPQYSQEEALKRTIEWYREVLK
jgi:CDP-glucose 4,6-dehydratase